jgi:hydrogenase maturation protein HypF
VDASPADVLDTRPLLEALLEGLARGTPVHDLSWLFHDALADAMARAAGRLAKSTRIREVALSGGCFLNVLLTERVRAGLEGEGLACLLHESVPPNDGGLAFGQAAVAVARLGA